MVGFWSRLRDRVLPGSIVARMSFILLIGILVAQGLSTLVWNQQFQQSERERLQEVSDVMGARIGQTLQFFSKLPRQYRHVVLDQLRDMGGTRFFVSVNQKRIALQTLPETETQTLVRERLNENIRAQLLLPLETIITEFIAFDDVRILSNENTMVQLPPKWQRFALIDPGDNSPVIVVQVPLADDEWMYLATVFPAGSVLSPNLLSTDRIISLIFVTITVVALITLMLVGVVRPLRTLARQADKIGRGQRPPIIAVEGTRELQSTIRAFNEMSSRIDKFIYDRERLFASISHDLKTPLTRARLRAEMVEDDVIRDGLVGDLENLDVMVKASLQMIKDGDIHENTQLVDLRKLIESCLKSAQVEGLPCHSSLPQNFQLEGRPLALERLFTNIIDNALHYGRGVEVFGTVEPDQEALVVQVCDRGPGLSNEQKNRVFKPFYRVDKAPSSVHAGLGMGIVKSIAQMHGASIELKDREGGGLIVELRFPLSHFVTLRTAE